MKAASSQRVFSTVVTSISFTSWFMISAVVEPPLGCRFLNGTHDPFAENAPLDFFESSESYTFAENNSFQPQCFRCADLDGEACFGYKGGASYEI